MRRTKRSRLEELESKEWGASGSETEESLDGEDGEDSDSQSNGGGGEPEGEPPANIAVVEESIIESKHLPAELPLKVFAHLSQRECGQASIVNKHWGEVVRRNPLLRRKILIHRMWNTCDW